MVEVFKTNITRSDQAKRVIDRINATFAHCKATFDLEDCDRILRVEYHEEMICPDDLLKMVQSLGYEAEILPDEIPAEANDPEVRFF